MINARRLSRLDIAISFIRNIRHLIPLIILGWIQIKDATGIKLLWIAVAAVLLLIINAVSSFLAWRKFQYALEQDRLIIRKGVFKREEKTIYYHRIHSVNVQQPLLLRIFGAASLQIETPGGKPGVAEGMLRVLKHTYALELQQQLKHLRSISSSVKVVDDKHGEGAQAAGEYAADVHAESIRAEGAQAAGEYAADAHTESKRVDYSLTDTSTREFERELEAGQFVNSKQQAAPYAVAPMMNSEDSSQLDYKYHLSFGQLLKASLTSFNLNFALLFIFGIYSFADDVLDIVYPGMYDKLFNSFIDQYSALPIFLLLVMTALGAGFVWLLSIAIYLIKFGDYQISRSQEQLAVSYGLLEKKSFIFDQNKIQAIIMDENPLRQWLGFAELRVQVITSNAMEQLVIHPFARKKDIPTILAQLLPDRTIELRKQLHAPPRSAFRTYATLPTIITLLIVTGTVWWWKWTGLWLLLLLPLIWSWNLVCMKSAGVWLEGNDLILRRRRINVTTYFVQRRHIVTLSLKSSPLQRKRELHTIQVQVLGSVFAYRVKSIANEHLLPIWSWYSRRN